VDLAVASLSGSGPFVTRVYDSATIAGYLLGAIVGLSDWTLRAIYNSFCLPCRLVLPALPAR
jgi:hypothetical protein